MTQQPLVRWDWIADHPDDIWVAFREHLELTLFAVAIGFVISFPLAVLAHRRRVFYGPVTWFTGMLYT
ncbi:MAG: ABC transporter permease, partial [Actinomycetota bacterium]|nr:ABC transporter permease [Actinomycetota bacterium]